MHRYRAAAAAACARARPAFRGPSPQTLRSALTTTGGPPPVSGGVSRPRKARARLASSSTTEPRTPPCRTPSAQGRLEGNALKLDLLTSGPDLDATPPRGGPRIRPEARESLERGRGGVGGMLLQLGDISLGPRAFPKSKFWAERAARQIRD